MFWSLQVMLQVLGLVLRKQFVKEPIMTAVNDQTSATEHVSVSIKHNAIDYESQNEENILQQFTFSLLAGGGGISPCVSVVHFYFLMFNSGVSVFIKELLLLLLLLVLDFVSCPPYAK